MNSLLGQQLRSERKKQGLTAERLARACDISRSYIILIERGKRMPGKKVLPKIATALNLNPNDILNWYLEDVAAKIKQNLDL